MTSKDVMPRADLERICAADFIPWDALRGKTVLITGATGLIGYAMTCALLHAGREKGLDLRVLALVRDEERASRRFAAQKRDAGGALQFAVGDIECLPPIDGPVDYIIHGASKTASGAFVHQAVETIRTAVHGTENMLELAREKGVSGMVYLSSMEVYGSPEKGRRLTEDDVGAMSPMEVRNSYPISKQLCESLCCAYAGQYGLPAMIVRLAQTFGPGINYDDNRVFAQFNRCVEEKRDIVLKTKGETERCYLYTADAVTAILTVLLKGRPGRAYNAADESTYCSIAEMAEKIARKGGVRVRFELEDARRLNYPKTAYLDLDTTLLRALGWRAESFPL